MKFILSILIVFYSSFSMAAEWSLANLLEVLSTPGSSVFCNAAAGKFTIELENDNLQASGLHYGNMLFENHYYENTPCAVYGSDVVCNLDSRRSVSISLSGVNFNGNDWDGPSNPGAQYELNGRVVAGNVLTETENLVCTISVP